jgi:hypothetical protein
MSQERDTCSAKFFWIASVASWAVSRCNSWCSRVEFCFEGDEVSGAGPCINQRITSAANASGGRFTLQQFWHYKLATQDVGKSDKAAIDLRFMIRQDNNSCCTQ